MFVLFVVSMLKCVLFFFSSMTVHPATPADEENNDEASASASTSGEESPRRYSNDQLVQFW